MLNEFIDNFKIIEPHKECAEIFIAAVKNSQDLHYPWVEPPSTYQAYYQYLAKINGDKNYGFFMLKKMSNKLIGVININEVVRGAFQSGYLGYYVFKPFQGKGFMSKAMQFVIHYAFTELKIHRLEANIQPENIHSIKFVEKLNFQKEGYSPYYLKINNKWQDHIRFAVRNEALETNK